MTRREFCGTIDHSGLKPWATRDQIRRLCEEARQYGFATVCVNTYWVKFAAELLEGSGVGVGPTVGFPLGACATRVKVFEAVDAIRAGASEVDVVMNIGALKGGEYASVLHDMRAVVEGVKSEAARVNRAGIVKVIIETCYLDDAEKVRASELAVEGGADFVKTSTGFAPGGATVEDVRLIRRAVAGKARIKAAGGIHTFAQAKELIEAGASRLGTSRSLVLVKEMEDSGCFA
ncbi:MAG: deoxyribose-phosphate aldolase [Firmicutes bacterium]|nr:deoxyribose-phosphate aldolase [Bacillota bacterium]